MNRVCVPRCILHCPQMMVGNSSCVSRDLDYCFYYSRYGTVISTVYLFLLATGGIILCILATLVWLCIVNALVCKLLNKTRKSIDLQPQSQFKLQSVMYVACFNKRDGINFHFNLCSNEYQASTSAGQTAMSEYSTYSCSLLGD